MDPEKYRGRERRAKDIRGHGAREREWRKEREGRDKKGSVGKGKILEHGYAYVAGDGFDKRSHFEQSRERKRAAKLTSNREPFRLMRQCGRWRMALWDRRSAATTAVSQRASFQYHVTLCCPLSGVRLTSRPVCGCAELAFFWSAKDSCRKPSASWLFTVWVLQIQ